MRTILLAAVLGVGCTGGGGEGTSADANAVAADAIAIEGSKLLMVTSLGEVAIELFPDEAPITTANFLRYVNEGYFDGKDGEGATHFHRVIAGFMVQGGGFTEAGSAKTVYAPIVNEAAASGLSNARGTLAMARTSDPNSATSQFYINVVDNDFLDATADDPGYAVFGEVTAGMDVVDQIAAVATDANDQPTLAVIIESIAVTE